MTCWGDGTAHGVLPIWSRIPREFSRLRSSPWDLRGPTSEIQSDGACSFDAEPLALKRQKYKVALELQLTPENNFERMYLYTCAVRPSRYCTTQAAHIRSKPRSAATYWPDYTIVPPTLMPKTFLIIFELSGAPSARWDVGTSSAVNHGSTCSRSRKPSCTFDGSSRPGMDWPTTHAARMKSEVYVENERSPEYLRRLGFAEVRCRRICVLGLGFTVNQSLLGLYVKMK